MYRVRVNSRVNGFLEFGASGDVVLKITISIVLVLMFALQLIRQQRPFQALYCELE